MINPHKEMQQFHEGYPPKPGDLSKMFSPSPHGHSTRIQLHHKAAQYCVVLFLVLQPKSTKRLNSIVIQNVHKYA